MSRKAAITLNINGRGYPIEVESRRTLADAIREDCGQTGTHIGCEHGICGACTVIVDGEPVRTQKRIDLHSGAVVRLELPGGGGYGAPSQREEATPA